MENGISNAVRTLRVPSHAIWAYQRARILSTNDQRAVARILGYICGRLLRRHFIYSKTVEEREEHVKKVLEKLRIARLLLKPAKCEFHKEELEIPRIQAGRKGVSMNAKKVEAVLGRPTLTTVKEVQAFIGFANFYRRFIQRYSKITTPLTELTKKDKAFNWSEQVQQAFEKLKERFTKVSILTMFDPKQKLAVETDASDFAIGACLSQKDEQDDYTQPRTTRGNLRRQKSTTMYTTKSY